MDCAGKAGAATALSEGVAQFDYPSPFPKQGRVRLAPAVQHALRPFVGFGYFVVYESVSICVHLWLK